MKEERKKVWIDFFQTGLFIRVGIYWFIAMITLMNLLIMWRLIYEDPGNPFEQVPRVLKDFYPALIVFMALFPVIAWDAVKFAHRLVGPLVRFRQTLRDLTEGKPVQLIKLRKDDLLKDMRDEFNAMLEALQKRGVPVLKPLSPAGTEPKSRTA